MLCIHPTVSISHLHPRSAYSFGTCFLQNSISAVMIFLEAVTRRVPPCISFSSLSMPCSLSRRCARSRCLKRSPLVAALDAMALDMAFPETKGEKLATLSAFCASNATQAVADDSVTGDACMSALAFCSWRARAATSAAAS